MSHDPYVETDHQLAILDYLAENGVDENYLTASIIACLDNRSAVTLVYADHVSFYLVHDDFDLYHTCYTDVGSANYTH